MKKFLSLVLALVMTMSLVTISAGATEYKDLTDKDEIQYEEAVAVLNRIGIITGYSDGSFQPKTELTRGAAAKIIVSLLIGTEAANNLVASTAPYTDVPVDHTFAAVISYCKTTGIINGYADGSFRPAGTLSGYAFSKMLLGALGYKGDIEGFTGAGWTMNVARLGNAAGLFDRLSFKGNETVNREQACQLALNTLKATTVEYTGGLTVTAGDASVVGGQTRSYVTSNNRDFALNISARSVEDGWWTVEFGEEHFVDLRLEHDKRNPTANDLGQPSAEWSYKKVTIGTYALTPDFSYTELVAHNDNSSTDASKVRALGLSGYEVDNSTQLWLNGYASTTKLGKVANIANYTDNGTVVEVYVSETDADLITDVVVIQSALMEVKRVGSDYVTLGKYDTDGSDTFRDSDGTKIKYEGYNRDSFDVVKTDGLVASKSFNDVQVEDRGYGVLSGLKAGDKVVVVPVAEDHGNANFDVWEAYVPETVTGALTRVETYGSSNSTRGTIGLTVAGTAYKAAEWNKDIIDIDGEAVKVTVKDVTLTLDKYGNALLAEDVGKTEEYMVVGYYYDSLIDGRLVKYVHGWDMNGNEVDLNLGRDPKVGIGDAEDYAKPGDLVRYSNSTSGSAEWYLEDGSETGDKANDAKIYAVDHSQNSNAYQITAYNTKIALTEASGHYKTNSKVDVSSPIDFASGVKFIYVEFNDDHEVESVEVRKGVQAASNQELRAYHGGTATDGVFFAGTGGQWDTAQAYVSGENKGTNNKNNAAVKAVVIKRESNTAISSNLLYIRDYLGSAQKSDNSNKIIYGYTVVMNTADGLAGEAKTIYSYENLRVGDFASYSEVQNDQVSDFYKLREHTSHFNKTTTSFVAEVDYILKSNDNIIVLKNDSYKSPRGGDVNKDDPAIKPAVGTVVTGIGIAAEKQTGEQVDRVRVSGKTQWVDLTPNHIASTKDLKDFKDVKLAMVVNDNVESDGFRDVAMIIVQDADRVTSGSGSGSGSASGGVKATVTRASNGQAKVTLDVTMPSWAAEGTIDADVLVDGVVSTNITQQTVNSDGTVNVLAGNPGDYSADTDLGVDNVVVDWTKAKVVTSGTVPTGISIKSTGTNCTVGAVGTIKLALTADVDAGTLVYVKQNNVGRAAGDPHRITAEEVSAGEATIETSAQITAGYTVDLTFATCTCTVQCAQASDTCPVCDAGHYSTDCQGKGGSQDPVTSACKVNTTGAWTMTEIDTTKASGTEVSFDITCATKIATAAENADVKAAISFTSAAGKTSPAVKSAVIKTRGVAHVDASPASVEKADTSKITLTGGGADGSDTTKLSTADVAALQALYADVTTKKLFSDAAGNTEVTVSTDVTVASIDLDSLYIKYVAGEKQEEVVGVEPVITIKFDMPREAVEITAITVDTSKLNPQG